MALDLEMQEARSLTVPVDVVRVLAPQEVSEHAILPLALEGGVLTVAVDPVASERVDLFLRLDHGMREVKMRPASRRVMEYLIESHFAPFWAERGWPFEGLPRLPGGPDAAHVSPPAAPERDDEVDDDEKAEGPAHPVVLVVESVSARRPALTPLLSEAGYEVRYAATLEDVEREIRLSPPDIVTVRRDGQVGPADVEPFVRGTRGRTELRIVPDPVEAVLGADTGDERLPRFLYDLTRFMVGVTAAAGGGSVSMTEARARHAEHAARRLGLAPAEVEAVRLAALLGDLDGHLARLRGDATSGPGATVLDSLLDPVRTPYAIADVLAQRTECWNGTGPRGLAGENIHAGARVLAAVDAFVSLRETCSDRTEADAMLRDESAVTLDPRAVEAVLRSDRAERLVDRLGQEEVRDRVVVVDPDPAAASLLEMRLSNAGFDVDVHRDGREALEALLADPPALVFCEVAVPGMDGFTLLLRLRRAVDTADIPFVFVSERCDRGSTMRGLELGADDFVGKPADLELLIAKAKGMVRKSRTRRTEAPSAAGVTGDLTEMELVDLLQVLAASGRTAWIRIDGSGGAPGYLSFEEGRLVDARAGDEEGLAAFHRLLTRKEGRFTVDSRAPERRTIDAPLESLLLEACRLLDEASRDEDPLAALA